MAGVTRQIIGSFEDIGKDILKQTASLPKDVVGKALESLGTSSGAKKQAGQTAQGGVQPGGEGTAKPNTPLDEIEQQTDRKIKQAIARNALQYLAKKPEEREMSVRERLEKEQEQKKELEKKQKEEAGKTELKPMSQKRRSGMMPGAAQKAKKQAGSETSRNVRQD